MPVGAGQVREQINQDFDRDGQAGGLVPIIGSHHHGGNARVDKGGNFRVLFEQLGGGLSLQIILELEDNLALHFYFLFPLLAVIGAVRPRLGGARVFLGGRARVFPGWQHVTAVKGLGFDD
jgi:hypothetical protein